MKCWGYNAYGQIGDGTTTDRATPVDVSGLAYGVAAISAGGLHTCALTTAAAVKCWGYNERGRLGIGTSTGPETCIVQFVNAYACSTTPVDVFGLTNAVSVSAGYFGTCAVTSAAGVECWGANSDGELGNGTSCGASPCGSAVPADVTGLTSGVLAVSAGTAHVCAIEAAGGIKCWGLNFYGQLGIGTNTGPEVCFTLVSCSTSPVSVTSLGPKPTPTPTVTPTPIPPTPVEVGGVSRDVEAGSLAARSGKGESPIPLVALGAAGACTLALAALGWRLRKRIAGGR